MQRSGSTQLVAERDGTIIATARQTPPDEGIVLGEMAGSHGGLRALVAAAARHGEVAVLERPGTAIDAVVAEHDTQHVHLLFNNAGIGMGGMTEEQIGRAHV